MGGEEVDVKNVVPPRIRLECMQTARKAVYFSKRNRCNVDPNRSFTHLSGIQEPGGVRKNSGICSGFT